MSDDATDNLRQLPGATRALTSLETSMELSRIAGWVASHQIGIEPTAYVLVLINQGKMRFVIQGFDGWELYDEAVAALTDFKHHQEFPSLYSSSHQERRARRTRRRREANAEVTEETNGLYRCAYCPKRFLTKRGWQQHEVQCATEQRAIQVDTGPPCLTLVRGSPTL